nr:MAG: hypothetical protein DIU80_06875 [Chloroflexota bacterium]
MRQGFLRDLGGLRERVQAGGPFIRPLEELLAADEVRAFRRRLDRLIDSGRYPHPGSGRSVPWPPV